METSRIALQNDAEDPPAWRQIERRSLLKYIGTAAAASGLTALAYTTSRPEFELLEIPPDQQHQIVLESGETFSNKLIDITAENADFSIIAKQDDWAIRNVGVRGQSNRGGTSVTSTEDHGYHFYLGGTGTFENVFLGHGSGPGVRKGAILALDTGEGHIDVRNAHIAEFAGLGIYAAGGAEDVRPTLGVENSYFRDNGNTHLRIAEQGTYVENSVIHNTGNVPPQPGGAIVSRGFWPWRYGDPSQTVTIRNCEIDFPSSGVAIMSTTEQPMSRYHCIEGNLRGEIVGPRPSQIELTNVDSSPDVQVPGGVPTSPEQAAKGASLLGTPEL